MADNTTRQTTLLHFTERNSCTSFFFLGHCLAYFFEFSLLFSKNSIKFVWGIILCTIYFEKLICIAENKSCIDSRNPILILERPICSLSTPSNSKVSFTYLRITVNLQSKAIFSYLFLYIHLQLTNCIK